MKEAHALLALEADAQRLFQSRAHRLERRRVARRLDTRETVARIRCEQPCKVLWLGERSPVRQRAEEIFAKTRAHVAGEGARSLQSPIEVVRTVRQSKRFEFRRRPDASSPTKTKSRVFVTSTNRYRFQYRLT